MKKNSQPCQHVKTDIKWTKAIFGPHGVPKDGSYRTETCSNCGATRTISYQGGTHMIYSDWMLENKP
jgi:hypothetical protein